MFRGNGIYLQDVKEEVTVQPDDRSLYRAFLAHDRRFDGKYFIGVTSTRIYCRPVCRVKAPKESNCRFFRSAAAAEQEKFRPCLKCRPELAPGFAAVDDSRRIAHAALKRIQAGALDAGRLDSIADEFGISERQFRRIVEQEFGVSPVQLAQTHRLLLAKRLLTETSLPVGTVAQAAGFGSARRLNVLLKERYRLTPTQIRGKSGSAGKDDAIEVALAFRPPLDWAHLIEFLAGRVIAGVEHRTERGYSRTLRIGKATGWLEVYLKDEHHLTVRVASSLVGELPAVLANVRDVFDLEADPSEIDGHLEQFEPLRRLVKKSPGLRVPGAFDAFEIALRTILGQQVSVAAATTISGRFAAKFGEKVQTPMAGLTSLTPTAERVAGANVDEIRSCGLPNARAECIRTMARAFADEKIRVTPSSDPQAIMESLQEIKGIGPWTAHYFVMRTLHWPDAFPEADLGILKALGTKKGREAAQHAEPWRPWRAYATMHLWKGLSIQEEP